MRIQLLLLTAFVLLSVFLLSACGGASNVPKDVSGFDEYGYNEVAGIFNGIADGVDRSNNGLLWGDPTYANDHLVMKWNSEWDRGNDEKWACPPYAAWENNEWNGQVDGGSGEIWHYKIIWVGTPANATNPNWREGGYAIWGQFEVIMSQGTADGHFWDVHAIASGYGGPE